LQESFGDDFELLNLSTDCFANDLDWIWMLLLQKAGRTQMWMKMSVSQIIEFMLAE
jgi:hypothetical protein